MADQTAVFAVELQDGVSNPAQAAAAKAAQLRDKLKSSTDSLSEMNRLMRSLKGATQPNTAAMTELKERMAAMKASSAVAAAELVNLGDAANPEPIQEASGSLKDLASVAASAGGPIGSVASLAQRAAKLLGSAGLAGAAIAAAASVVTLVVGIGSAAIALGKFALASSDARRSELLHLEGLTKTINYWGIAAGKASDLQQAIDDVSSGSALGRGEIAGYSEQLYRMGLRGSNLSKALEATAIVASTQGSGMAQSFMGMAAGAGAMGQSVDKLAERVKSRLGGIAQRQTLALGVQFSKLRENIARIFSGVKIEGFLQELNVMTHAFSQNEAIGRALKTLVETLFNPVFGGASGAGLVVKRFFQGVVIGALVAAITVLRLKNLMASAFGVLNFGGIDVLSLALNAGMFAASALLAVLVVLGAVAGSIVAPFIALNQAIQKALTIDGNSLATHIIDGLTFGLLSGEGPVANAVTSLAEGIKKGFTSALGIASPSRVFRAYGVFIPQGTAEGIEAGAPMAQSAADSMIAPPSIGEVAPVRGGSVTGHSIRIDTINVSGGGDAHSLASAFRLELERVLEGLALEMGAPA